MHMAYAFFVIAFGDKKHHVAYLCGFRTHVYTLIQARSPSYLPIDHTLVCIQYTYSLWFVGSFLKPIIVLIILRREEYYNIIRFENVITLYVVPFM